MQASRRHRYATRFVLGAAFAAAPAFAQAQQNYPVKPIRLVISTTAASQPDTLARMFAQKMSESWGRPVIVDNRPGASGLLAASPVARAAPDGYTLIYTLPNFAISAAMQPSLPYDPLKDYAGATQIGFSANLLVVAPTLGVKTIKEFIALAKAQPGKFIFGSSSTGSASHLSGARFNLAAGIKVIQVAFKGGPEAMIEVLGGRVHYTVATLGVALPFIQDGKVVPLAMTAPWRTPVLPDVPSLAELLSEFKQPETSHAILAPAGTPRPILNQISKEMARILGFPDVKERMQAIGFVAAPTTPEECDKILRAQITTLSKLIRDAGLQAR